MKTNLFSALLLGLLFNAPSLLAQRKQISLNENWRFRFSYQVERGTDVRVDLPHTWNTLDALSGKLNYDRCIGNYSKQIEVPTDWQGKRVYIRFEGANTVTNFFVNGKHIGEHRGGYGAFIFELTKHLTYGKPNTLLARVNNSEQLDIMPLVGDFNFYGGIYRNVELLLTDETCISPLDYASPGVYLQQREVSAQQAQVNARIALANSKEESQIRTLKLEVKEGDKTIHTQEQKVVVEANALNQMEEVVFSLEKPRLWNGTADPFMYQVEVTLLNEDQVIDQVVQPLGLRHVEVDANRGFILNGKPLQLRGVCRHQERAQYGNALHPHHHEEDVAIMQEMGVNAVRLAHYPQSTYTYQLMDNTGMVTWAEIPFIGPGGYLDKGYVDQPSFHANGKEQLKEMIRQHYNHPSICFWGLFNELKEQGDNPIEYVKELNKLAHLEDPTRYTTSASNQGGNLNYITDLIAWNRYDGWYGSTPKTLATWLDATHEKNPNLKIGISEYGAGASMLHQQDTLTQTVPTSRWHPENWQTYYHMENWDIISSRPFLWASFVWNMFDFGATHRAEGDRIGINDKGLVTHDRKERKDAFYFYKANWNPEPMLYLAERRVVARKHATTTIMAFSNCSEVELHVNGQRIGTTKPDHIKRCLFERVSLKEGENLIEVKAKVGKQTLVDSTVWVLTP